MQKQLSKAESTSGAVNIQEVKELALASLENLRRGKKGGRGAEVY